MNLGETGRARKPDHSPADLPLVAAIDRVGAEALPRVRDEQREEVEVDLGRRLLESWRCRDRARQRINRQGGRFASAGLFEFPQHVALLPGREIDEVSSGKRPSSAIKIAETPGWSSRGTRLVAKVPHGRVWTAPLARATPCVFDGPITGAMFTAWIKQSLVPTLRPGDIVVVDNLPGHKNPRAREAIRQVGAHLLFLPPYSPDLNTIEMMFAKLKTLFRKAETRSVETAWRKVGTLLDEFDAKEYANDFRHAGYLSRSPDLL